MYSKNVKALIYRELKQELVKLDLVYLAYFSATGVITVFLLIFIFLRETEIN